LGLFCADKLGNQEANDKADKVLRVTLLFMAVLIA